MSGKQRYFAEEALQMIFEENEEVCEESSNSILSMSCDDSTDVEQLTSVSEIESDDDNEYCVRQNSFTLPLPGGKRKCPEEGSKHVQNIRARRGPRTRGGRRQLQPRTKKGELNSTCIEKSATSPAPPPSILPPQPPPPPFTDFLVFPIPHNTCTTYSSDSSFNPETSLSIHPSKPKIIPLEIFRSNQTRRKKH